MKLGVVLAVVSAILLQPVDAVAAPALEAETAPSPGLSPEEVVRIQVEALRTNDATNAGIALVFWFASPQNRKTTGPLSRFTQMIRTPPYALMLNHRTASYGPTTLGDSRMRQEVTITADDGTTTRFVWLVSRQEDGPYGRSWMTDAVFAVDRDGQDMPVCTRHPVS